MAPIIMAVLAAKRIPYRDDSGRSFQPRCKQVENAGRFTQGGEMAGVTFEDVSKIYPDGTKAVDDIDLEIEDGEFMVLVGPSGCGKSTALRMVAGLEDISEGVLRIGDRVVNHVPPRDRDIAMVFQSYALYPHLSVYDNIAFGLKLKKLPKAEIDTRVKEAARTLGLEEYLGRKPRALSGGQRQRVAMGRAIVREPQAFLMDEPLSNLDAKLRVQTRAEIARLHQRLGTTMVYVTHDQVEAMTMGQRIAVMSDGLLQQVGTPQQLYDHPINRFVAGFIGSPSMNFVEVAKPDGVAEIRTDHLNIPLAGAFREGLVNAGEKVVVGFRPEHLELGEVDGPTGSLQGTADVVEYLGNEELLHVTSGGKDIVAIVDSEHRVRPGDVVQLKLPADKVHMFNAETGLSILRNRDTATAAA